MCYIVHGTDIAKQASKRERALANKYNSGARSEINHFLPSRLLYSESSSNAHIPPLDHYSVERTLLLLRLNTVVFGEKKLYVHKPCVVVVHTAYPINS